MLRAGRLDQERGWAIVRSGAAGVDDVPIAEFATALVRAGVGSNHAPGPQLKHGRSQSVGRVGRAVRRQTQRKPDHREDTTLNIPDHVGGDPALDEVHRAFHNDACPALGVSLGFDIDVELGVGSVAVSVGVDFTSRPDVAAALRERRGPSLRGEARWTSTFLPADDPDEPPMMWWRCDISAAGDGIAFSVVGEDDSGFDDEALKDVDFVVFTDEEPNEDDGWYHALIVVPGMKHG